VYRYLGAVDAERQQHEMTRVLYVAATRARRQLHVFGRPDYSQKKGFYAASGSFLQMLMPAFERAFDESGYQPGDRQVAETTPPTLPLLYLDGAPRIGLDCPDLRSGHGAKPLSLPDRDAVALGEALHLWLELIHDHCDRDWTPAWFDAHEDMLQSLLLRTGADKDRLGELLLRLKSMIRAALETETGRRAVSPLGCKESHAELALFKRAGNRVAQRVIDRLHRDGSGSWHIVDYKTGRSGDEQQEQWSRQLGEYAQLVRAATGTDVPDCVVYQAEEGRLISISPDPEDDSAGAGGQ
jgi:ATP-dependent exoDNAse (exonuclease V) beta subunit